MVIIHVVVHRRGIMASLPETDERPPKTETKWFKLLFQEMASQLNWNRIQPPCDFVSIVRSAPFMDRRALADGCTGVCESAPVSAKKGNMTISRTDPFSQRRRRKPAMRPGGIHAAVREARIEQKGTKQTKKLCCLRLLLLKHCREHFL